MVDFHNIWKGSRQLRQNITARREAQSEEEGAAIVLEHAVFELMNRVVSFEYNSQSRLRGVKAQRFNNEKWTFMPHTPGPRTAFVTGFGVDELEGAYLEATQIGLGGTWRIYLDGLTGLEIVEVENLQHQPG